MFDGPRYRALCSLELRGRFTAILKTRVRPQLPADASKRAAALRQVAENALLPQRELNRAFVLMQYFGYLRRNPDDPQDVNFRGWSLR
jgi:hypothetical protein